MANRTAFGKQLIAGQWAAAEFAILSRLWSAGAAVPYPVQLLGTELMMELIGDADGTAAPRLAQLRPDAGARPRRCTASCAPCSCSWPMPATPTATCRPTTCSSTTAAWC